MIITGSRLLQEALPIYVLFNIIIHLYNKNIFLNNLK